MGCLERQLVAQRHQPTVRYAWNAEQGSSRTAVSLAADLSTISAAAGPTVVPAERIPR